jgi:hypothetical protein
MILRKARHRLTKRNNKLQNPTAFLIGRSARACLDPPYELSCVDHYRRLQPLPRRWLLDWKWTTIRRTNRITFGSNCALCLDVFALRSP